MKPRKPCYCPDCGKELKLANVHEILNGNKPQVTVYIYWCEDCSQFVGKVGNIIRTWKGKKPTQWIN